MARFDLSARAEADLQSIADYGATQWGRQQAAEYVGALRDRIALLAGRPRLGRPRDELAAGLRSFLFESHVVFYAPGPSGIYVVRILHQRQDVARHLD